MQGSQEKVNFSLLVRTSLPENARGVEGPGGQSHAAHKNSSRTRLLSFSSTLCLHSAKSQVTYHHAELTQTRAMPEVSKCGMVRLVGPACMQRALGPECFAYHQCTPNDLLVPFCRGFFGLLPSPGGCSAASHC